MPPLTHIAQVVVKGKVDLQDYRNVMHFGTDLTINDGNAPTTLLELAQEVMETYTSTLLPGLTAGMRIESVEAKRIFPALTDSYVDDTGAGNGAAAGDALPSFCSMQLDLKTGGGGRRNRGRLFLFPPAEANTLKNELLPAAVTLLETFTADILAKFIGAGGSSDWQIGVLSRAAIEKDNAAINVAFKPVTTISVVNLVAVQRRRKVGKGS